MIDLNTLSSTCHKIAIKRGKVGDEIIHWKSASSISDELMEFIKANEESPSEHLPEYTEAQEELTDVLICCLTELHRRGVDMERIIKEKIEFNKTRDAAGK